MRSVFLAVQFSLIAFLWPINAKATPVPSSQATEIIFNFDITGLAPAPPYWWVEIQVFLVSPAPGAFYQDIFGGANGLNLIESLSVVIPAGSSSPGIHGIDPNVKDGIFSIGFYTDITGVEFSHIQARAHVGDFQSEVVTSWIDGTTAAVISEPDTISTLGLGIAMLAMALRRKSFKPHNQCPSTGGVPKVQVQHLRLL
ncbi:MAG: hypothetical protein V4508_14105 [Pseudomonadota bacterium]